MSSLHLRISCLTFVSIFLRYWLPSFLKHTHIGLRFLPQASYERAAPLEVSPAPDVVTRVFMLFRGIHDDDELLSEWVDSRAQSSNAEFQKWREVVGVDLDKASDTKLFRVLEWGGMEVF